MQVMVSDVMFLSFSFGETASGHEHSTRRQAEGAHVAVRAAAVVSRA